MNVLLVINFVAAKKIIIYSIKHVFDCDNYNCSIFYDYDSDQYYCSRLNLLYLHMTFVCIQVLSACLYTCICLLDRCLRCSTNNNNNNKLLLLLQIYSPIGTPSMRNLDCFLQGKPVVTESRYPT